MKSDGLAPFDILAIGLDEGAEDFLFGIVDRSSCHTLKTGALFEEFLEKFELKAGTTAFVGSHLEGVSYFEVGQALRSYFPTTRLVFVTSQREKFEVTDLRKNGFNEILLLPSDRTVFEEEILSAKARSGGVARRFKAIKMIDIEPGVELTFEVRTFLPLNNKYVTVASAGGVLSDRKYQKLKEQSVNSLYIDSNDVEKFYEFTAERLAQLGDPNKAMSATERTQKLQTSVRQLFHNILDVSKKTADFQDGKDLLEQSQMVVEKFVESKTKIKIHDQIKKVLGENKDGYSHAQSVSTLACLLSMGLEIGDPTDLAIAGLFHDIALFGFQIEPTPFNYKNLSDEDQKRYFQHPVASLNLLREKRITVPPKVAEMIERHHERVDAKGFPHAIQPHKFTLEAQLLSFADMFEYLTRVEHGRKRLSPLEAIEEIAKTGALSHELIAKARKFFLSVESSQTQALTA